MLARAGLSCVQHTALVNATLSLGENAFAGTKSSNKVTTDGRSKQGQAERRHLRLPRPPALCVRRPEGPGGP